MPRYTAPVQEIDFLLADVLRFDRYRALPGFAEASTETVGAILTEAARFATDVLHPLNQTGDRIGCRRDEAGDVTTPPGFKQAYDRYVEAAWSTLSGDPAFGGQGLPFVLATIVNEFMASANMAFSMYPGLTQSACSALLAHGDARQKSRYVPKLLSGEWSGTMNLTEPHCGTDLGLIKTKATPRPDGSYALSGQKIFISAGEHDLSKNIVHLVLARIEGAPAGTKGLSLFIVPKLLVGQDGSPGNRNGVSCGSLETKMGIHASPTCVMNYDGARGELLGEANRGLQAMFVMMNEARIGVATQGLALSEIAYQNAAAYARDRLQGRALGGAKAPNLPADPIIVHADVRRMLMTIRCFNEPARALLVWAALQADVSHRSPDAEARQAAEDRLGLMTPVLKGVLTDTGLQNCILAQQVLGGHGYVADWGLEQFVRDVRITTIYEGANGIQALDLVARKLPRNGGRAFMAFTSDVTALLKAQAGNERLSGLMAPLKEGLGRLQQATMWLAQHGMAKPDDAGAASNDYMHLFGLVALGYMWGLIAVAAVERKQREGGDVTDMDTKLVVARFFMERQMPKTAAHLARITAGSDTLMALPAESF